VLKKAHGGVFQVNVLDPVFMAGQTISDMIEFEKGFLLAVNYYDCTYHKIDIL
jgi:hypothetical protein